jgi:uncharacterized protein (DUF2164 family)
MQERDLVISYELARELKAAGAPQSSTYYWCGWKYPDRNFDNHPFGLYTFQSATATVRDYAENNEPLEMFSAYTLEELGRIMLVPFHSGRLGSHYYAQQMDAHGNQVCELYPYSDEKEARGVLLKRVLLQSKEKGPSIQLDTRFEIIQMRA